MSLIPPSFLDNVVALGASDDQGKVTFKASGFLYGQPSEELGKYYVYLVTNRHVVDGMRKPIIRFNAPVGLPAKVLPLPPKDGSSDDHWTYHPDPEVDVAVLLVDAIAYPLPDVKVSFFSDDKDAESLQSLQGNTVAEGDEVSVLGFPLGLAGDEQNYVIVRQGTIARIRDCYEGHSKNFLIDSFIFPGNSGGPAIVKPTMFSYGQTRTQAKLIGMVLGYVPFIDVALSQQTGKPRLMTEENSGLASVIPVDLIRQTIDVASARHGISQPTLVN